MYIRRNLRWSLIWRFAWRSVVFFTLYSSAVVAAYQWAAAHGIDISIPFAPLGTIGVAVAFYIGFKNNQAYDRFWEGRKIWGAVVNESRSWANLVLSVITEPDGKAPGEALRATHRRLIHRHLSWINALRIQLRKTTIHDREHHTNYVPDLKIDLDRDHVEDMCKFISKEEKKALGPMRNMATHLVRAQGNEVRALRAQGYIDGFREQLLHGVLRELYTLQGKCERIKNTPLPRQFAYFSAAFVWLFIFLLPFGLLSQFEQMEGDQLIWLTVPCSVLISWVFNTIEVVGDSTEDPFENYINDVPMTALCKTIEIDLRQMLDDENLPEPTKPVQDILL